LLDALRQLLRRQDASARRGASAGACTLLLLLLLGVRSSRSTWLWFVRHRGWSFHLPAKSENLNSTDQKGGLRTSMQTLGNA
jgi:hypothetical protein